MGTTPQPAATTAANTAGRAALAVAMLAGFYLLAAAIVLGLLGLDIALSAGLGHVSLGLLKIYALSAAVAYPVRRVVFLTRRPRDRAAGGLPVTREQQPELWARVDRIAALTGVRGPAEIRLVPDVDAGVRKETRLLGLVPGPRYLVIGAPLLLGLSEAELDSVLAHEFGHYSNRDVRLAGVTVAGRTALLHTIGTLHRRADAHRAGAAAEIAAKDAERLAKGKQAGGEEAGGGADRVLAGLFTQYAKLYFRVSEAVSRRQEYAADRAAATIAGRDATAAALRRIPVLDAAQGFYMERYATMWHGSHELMHAFADTAASTAPAGSLLTALRLEAYWEQYAGTPQAPQGYLRPELGAALDAALADLAAAPADHHRLADARGWAALLLHRHKRHAEAVEQFRALGETVPLPWSQYENPVAAFTGDRAAAVLAAVRTAAPAVGAAVGTA